MAGIDPGSAREEAERLVATALAAARLAASGHNPIRSHPLGPLGDMISGWLGPLSGPAAAGGASTASGGAGSVGGFATGDPECCVCPICRVMAALRDPSPEFAERLATGAGDFAAGVASLLRALATATPQPAAGPDPWGQATRAAARPDPAEAAVDPNVGGAAADPNFGGGSGPDARGSATRTGAEPNAGGDPEPDVWASVTRATREPAGPAGWSAAGKERAAGDPDGPSARDGIWRDAAGGRHDSGPEREPDVWTAATRADTDVPPARPAEATARPVPTGTGPAAHQAAGRPEVPATRAPAAPERDDAPGDGA